MPERQFITRVPGVKVQDVVDGNSFEIRGIAEIQSDTVCPTCGSQRFRIKSTRERTFKHGLWNQRLVLLKVKIPKLLCKQCGRYFALRIPGILPKKRSTEQFRQEVFRTSSKRPVLTDRIHQLSALSH